MLCLFGIVLAGSRRILLSRCHNLSKRMPFFSSAPSWSAVQAAHGRIWWIGTLIERTRLRPIARGAISSCSAFAFTSIQVMVGIALLLLLLPTTCLYFSIPSMVFTAIYPLAKRVIHYPQVILGLVFSWGVIMAFPALDLDLMSSAAVAEAVSCLYMSCVAWTVLYDTIYGIQDLKEDRTAGVKSIPVRHESHLKAVLLLSGLTQVWFLIATGLIIGASRIYFCSTCTIFSLMLATMIEQANPEKMSSCLWWFKHGSWLTGEAIASGSIAEYAIRKDFRRWLSVLKSAQI